MSSVNSKLRTRTVDDGEKGKHRDRDGRHDRGTDAKDKGDSKRRHEHRKDAHGSKHSLAQKETVKKDLTSLMRTPVKTKAGPSTPKRGTKPVWDSEEDGLELADYHQRQPEAPVGHQTEAGEQYTQLP